MIDIKTATGTVLYTAENASDLRSAVERAVRDGANLVGANLVGAYLGGANLDGAYLGGANLDGAIWRQVAVALRAAIEAMNDSGRHWIKGALEQTLEDESTAYCAIGSIEATCDGTVRALALWLLSSVTAGRIESFNDHEQTTWADVEAVFAVAIRNAQRFAAS